MTTSHLPPSSAHDPYSIEADTIGYGVISTHQTEERAIDAAIALSADEIGRGEVIRVHHLVTLVAIVVDGVVFVRR